MYFRIQHLEGSKKGQDQMVPGPVITFGRDPACSVAFDPAIDDQVSTNHAQILLTDKGDILLSDLGSRNGTFVGGQRLKGPLTIGTGTEISFGEKGPKVAFHLVPVAAPQAAPPPPLIAPAQPKKSKAPLIIGLLLLVIVVVVVIVVATSD